MRTENGNALWFILIAVMLLGLLTVAMTRGGSSSNETGSYEQNQIIANEVLRYASSIENGVQSLIARGCSENDISFWHDSDGNGTEDGSDDYYNDDSPADRSCHIFQAEGAGLSYIDPNERWLDSNTGNIAHGSYYITGYGLVEDVDSTSAELLFILPLIKEGLCTSLNQTLGVSVIPVDDGIISTAAYEARKFTGTFPTASYGLGDDSGLSNNGVIDGKTSLCIQTQGNAPLANTYHFYHVLHAR